MAVVSLNIGGRFYKFSCNDGQEGHMRELAYILDKKAEQLQKTLGFMQEGQLLAMLSLLLAQEIYVGQQKDENTLGDKTEEIVQTLQQATDKINLLCERLK